jgi:hypothetical protein
MYLLHVIKSDRQTRLLIVFGQIAKFRESYKKSLFLHEDCAVSVCVGSCSLEWLHIVKSGSRRRCKHVVRTLTVLMLKCPMLKQQYFLCKRPTLTHKFFVL